MTTANTRHAFGLTLLTNSHRDIRQLKKQHPQTELHGNKFWKSSYVLMDYLNEYPPEDGCRILELGCGWGMGGIFCAKQFHASVVALDADDNVFPFLEHHAQLNGVAIDTIQMKFEEISTDDLSQFDMLIGADICFWDELTPIVGDLLQRALDAGVPRIVLTDPGRPPFRAMAESLVDDVEAVYTDWDVPEPHNAWGLVLDIDSDTGDITS